HHASSPWMARIHALHDAFHAQADTLLALTAVAPWNPEMPAHAQACAELTQLSRSLHDALMALADHRIPDPA
ncbi:MAG: hypothetical protein ACOVO0_02450, partial [Burkholderiaceae bacterium]